MSAIKLAGGFDGDLLTVFELAKETKSSNIIKFFNEMVKGAKTAAASVDDSAGRIKKALAGISGGAKGAWNSLGLFGKIGIVITALGTLYGIYQKIQNAGAEANQKMDESVSKYEQTVSELKSVNSELSDTQRYFIATSLPHASFRSSICNFT